MTIVKICGITNFPDAEQAVDSGANAIGFNFYRGSKRYISPPEAGSIGAKLLKPVMKFGIFVNGSIEEILDAKFIAELDAIQLHGGESPAFIEQIRQESDAKIIKAFRVGPGFEPNEVLEYKADAILLDAYSDGVRGGTGKTIDWTIAKEVAELVDELYLAGGLSPDNVADAINEVRPFAVDACSRLESSPGKKNPSKVAAFIKAAREAI